jgi:hypothetical protein
MDAFTVAVNTGGDSGQTLGGLSRGAKDVNLHGFLEGTDGRSA